MRICVFLGAWVRNHAPISLHLANYMVFLLIHNVYDSANVSLRRLRVIETPNIFLVNAKI